MAQPLLSIKASFGSGRLLTSPNANRRLAAPAADPGRSGRSGTGVQHGDGATVLRPAGDVVTDRDRTLLAVGDGPHPAGVDAARGQEGAHRLGTAGAQRDVIFAGAALVGMAFDGERVAVVALQPLRLLFQG